LPQNFFHYIPLALQTNNNNFLLKEKKSNFFQNLIHVKLIVFLIHIESCEPDFEEEKNMLNRRRKKH